MKVKELKELLNQCDDEDIVILAKDGEGNEFSPLEELCTGKYGSGRVGLRGLNDELIEQGFSEEDVIEDGENAIILYPVN